jgi:hypothetical protein
MRECTHIVKAEQPRNLGYMQLGVIGHQGIELPDRAAVVEVLQ